MLVTKLFAGQRAAADMYGCEVEINTVGTACSFKSDFELCRKAEKIYSQMSKGAALLEKSFTASEDFTNIAVYAEKNGSKMRIFYIWQYLAVPHHSSNFDFDDGNTFY